MTFNEKQLQEIGLSRDDIFEFIKMEVRGDRSRERVENRITEFGYHN